MALQVPLPDQWGVISLSKASPMMHLRAIYI